MKGLDKGSFRMCTIGNSLLPAEGPKSLNTVLNFDGVDGLTLHDGFLADSEAILTAGHYLSMVQTLYVDASATDSPIVIGVDKSGQIVIVKGRTQGWYPVVAPNKWIFTFKCAVAAVVPVILCNYQVAPAVWDATHPTSTMRAGRNLLVDTTDITTANWTLNGGSRTATTTTDNTASVATYVTQAASLWTYGAHVASVSVAKDSTTSRFPMLGLSFAGGTTRSYRVLLNTSTGEYLAGATSGISAGVVDEGASWRLWVSGAPQAGNTGVSVYFFPARRETWGNPDASEIAAEGTAGATRFMLDLGSQLYSYVAP
jgi:hypothetical protein